MKRVVFLFVICLALLASLTACGLKSNPEKPNKEFPRFYPVK